MQILFQKHLSSISDKLPVAIDVTHADGSRQVVGYGDTRVSLEIRNPSLYRRMLFHPSLAFGEGYAAGDIVVASGNLFDLFKAFWSAKGSPRLGRIARRTADFFGRFSPATNTVSRAHYNVVAHYDKFHSIVSLIVDETTRLYSCAFFAHPDDSLANAQQQKADRSLAKLGLESGQTLLEIGCGYGYIARQAARRYGVSVTALTRSDEQLKVSQRLAAEERLPVTTLNADYRQIKEKFDHIISVAMYEAVGRKHWDEYFGAVARMLKPGGMFMLHTVTQKHWNRMDEFIDRHIFPGSELPTPAQVLTSAEKADFRFHHAESWKPHYAKTLLTWYDNLRRRKEEVYALFSSEKEATWYYRLWEIYLTGCAASFSVDDGMGLDQFLFSQGNAAWDIASLELPDARRENVTATRALHAHTA